MKTILLISPSIKQERDKIESEGNEKVSKVFYLVVTLLLIL